MCLVVVATFDYARLRFSASPATPRRSRSPLVGSGTAAHFDAFWVAVAILPNVMFEADVA